jgi:hypothetical protein
MVLRMLTEVALRDNFLSKETDGKPAYPMAPQTTPADRQTPLSAQLGKHGGYRSQLTVTKQS